MPEPYDATGGSESAPVQKDSLITEADLPRVRTYAADMSEVIKKRGETLASIVNKEKTSPVQEGALRERAPWSMRKIALVAGAGVLVLSGIGTLVAVTVFSPKTTVTTAQDGAIIFPNKTERLSLTEGADLAKELATTRANESLSLGEIARITVTGDQGALSPTALAEKLGLPSALVRETQDIMIGVHAFDRNQPFIIIKVGAYDRAFGAMLSFERDMGRTLDGFFAPSGTTESAPSLTFTDTIIRNLDARVSQDAWPILYTFPSQNLLIITTNQYTLREIMTRLGAADQSP